MVPMRVLSFADGLLKHAEHAQEHSCLSQQRHGHSLGSREIPLGRPVAEEVRLRTAPIVLFIQHLAAFSAKTRHRM